jgi:hypothetical protein
LETLFYHYRKAASLMWLLGFLTSGELKSSCYGPTIYSWSEESLHIQAVAYDIRSSTCTPFPHPPQSCSWGFSDVEMSWVVLLMSCTKVKFCIFFSILWLQTSSISV